MPRPDRDRLIAVGVLAVLSMGLAAVGVVLELEGGDGRRLGMLAGAPLLAAVLLAALGGKRG